MGSGRSGKSGKLVQALIAQAAQPATERVAPVPDDPASQPRRRMQGEMPAPGYDPARRRRRGGPGVIGTMAQANASQYQGGKTLLGS